MIIRSCSVAIHFASQFLRVALETCDPITAFDLTCKSQVIHSTIHMAKFAASFTSLEGHTLHISPAFEVVADLYLNS